MREGWVESSIGEVCDVIAGQSPKGTNYNERQDGLPFYQGKKNFGARHIKAATKWTTQITKVAHPGDILMSVRAPVGPINIATERICIGRGLAAIQASERIVRDFLFYALLKMQDQIQGNEGAVFASINKKQIEDLPFHYPPLPEQKRIVEILDEAFAAIATATANTEKNLANAKELFESYLGNLSCEKQHLGDFVNIKTGKLNANAAVDGGKYPFFTCSREVYEIDDYAFDCEAVLLAGNNASGDFNVKYFNGRFNAYQRTYVITIKTNGQLLYRFLYFQLIGSLGELKKRSVGVGTKFLKLGMIEALLISTPPLEDQQKLLQALEQLTSDTEQLESRFQQKLSSLTEPKQSILHKAFTGELTANKKAADRVLSKAGV